MSIITIQTENSEINNILKSLLEKIKGVKIISETESRQVIGYRVDKTPIFAEDYYHELKTRISDLEKGKERLFSGEEVLNNILKK